MVAARGTEQTFEEYREERKRVKAVVREAGDRFGAKLSQVFEGNRKMFWKKEGAERRAGG